MHVSFLWMLISRLRQFQKRVIFSEREHLNSEAKLHSLRTVNWSVGTDYFSLRETHVSFFWILVSRLRHFQRKVIFSERTAFRNATLHSLRTMNWSVGTDCFPFRETHVNFCSMLVSSLRRFQRTVIFSERTAFRKWSNTPFTSHSELKCWNRLLLFQRNACEFFVKACK